MSETFRSPYSGYDVLDKWNTPSWNNQTRDVVARRLNHVPERQFLEPDEYAILEAVCARLLPQPDRNDPVPIAPWIDQKLAQNQGDGYRYEGLPPMREAWRRGLRGIDEESQLRCGAPFVEVSGERQDEILHAVHNEDTKSPIWKGVSAKRFFTGLLLAEVVLVYYAYPAAWSEIGFGGPASPRGYARLQANRRDPWEAEERHV